jgi:DNA-binding CsgD family transcriptional regulator/GAF domain-containing protein
MAQQSVPVPDLLAQSREVVARAERALGIDGFSPTGPGTGKVHDADAALSAARRALTDRLAVAQASGESVAATRLAALVLRAEHTQLSLRDTMLAAQRHEMESAQAALHRLREAMSTSTLAERIPAEACRMGFTRVLFSYVKQGMWVACSAFAGDDDEMAIAMVEAGAANPRRLAGPLLEGEMVRCGRPILVRNPQTDPRVHNELAAATKSVSYVAAPIYSWGRPIGLIHADRHTGDYVAEFDRQTLGIFAEGLGIAFERNTMLERLQAMRRAADEHLRTANALADDFTLEVMDLAGPAPDLTQRLGGGDPSRLPRASPDSRLLDELTTREAEVLRAIAAGKTNAQIGTALFVTEGTVKSHVKHILRKLGAGNRTEAVAKYHRAQSTSAAYSVLS